MNTDFIIFDVFIYVFARISRIIIFIKYSAGTIPTVLEIIIKFPGIRIFFWINYKEIQIREINNI